MEKRSCRTGKMASPSYRLSCVICWIFEQLIVRSCDAAQCKHCISQRDTGAVTRRWCSDKGQIKALMARRCTFISVSVPFMELKKPQLKGQAAMSNSCKKSWRAFTENMMELNNKNKQITAILCVVWLTNLCRSSAVSSSKAFFFSGSSSSCRPC